MQTCTAWGALRGGWDLEGALEFEEQRRRATWLGRGWEMWVV
jgi:hypothetical protein